MRTWHKAVPALAAIGVLVGGCNDAEPATTAQPTTTSPAVTTSTESDANLWDPCELPESALSAAGINTSTKERDVAGVDFEDWKVCGWQDAEKTYSFTAASTAYTLADAKARTDDYTDFTDTTIGPYKAVQYRPVGASSDLACYIDIEVASGMIDFSVGNRVSAKNPSEPCGEVRRIIEALVPYLPTA
ncbi:MAG: DUF3558 domain-containing protein [Nocardia sp.]|nr:DUF3558 domain-containing protein [Nocardia sp.]